MAALRVGKLMAPNVIMCTRSYLYFPTEMACIKVWAVAHENEERAGTAELLPTSRRSAKGQIAEQLLVARAVQFRACDKHDEGVMEILVPVEAP